jgi:hypothetical protein
MHRSSKEDRCKLHRINKLIVLACIWSSSVHNHKVMKNLITILLATFISFASVADTGALETVEVKTDLVGVKFEDNNKTLVLTFSDQIESSGHCVIKIARINDLEYKTRVMRYFGGLLVNETHKFKNLVVVIDGKRMKYDWSRGNVSIMVKKMCQQAEYLL